MAIGYEDAQLCGSWRKGVRKRQVVMIDGVWRWLRRLVLRERGSIQGDQLLSCKKDGKKKRATDQR
jgi:hypothetical protein